MEVYRGFGCVTEYALLCDQRHRSQGRQRPSTSQGLKSASADLSHASCRNVRAPLHTPVRIASLSETDQALHASKSGDGAGLAQPSIPSAKRAYSCIFRSVCDVLYGVSSTFIYLATVSVYVWQTSHKQTSVTCGSESKGSCSRKSSALQPCAKTERSQRPLNVHFRPG